MFLKREAHIQNDHARRAAGTRRASARTRAAAAPSGNGNAAALFLATFSLCLWGGGAFVAKEKFDAMRADLARLSTVAAANTCAAENIAAGGNTPSRAIAAISPRAEEPFLISQSPLFSINRLD
jgi:hypothetical protein